MTADNEVRERVAAAARVVVLAGAGMSAESGVPTFRDAHTGLWERFRAEDLATPEAWQQQPDVVWAWYLWRAGLVRAAQPHAGHRALASLARRVPLQLVTQNVDDLHERAGSTVTAHLHGSLFAFRCDTCSAPAPVPALLPEPVASLPPPRCPRGDGLVRPDVVWFGEALPHEAWRASSDAVAALRPGDVMLVVGTSGLVVPAADLPVAARRRGATVVEVNPHETAVSDVADVVLRGTAAELLPLLVP